MDRRIIIEDFPKMTVEHTNESAKVSLELIDQSEGISTYKLRFKSAVPMSPQPITLRWRHPYINMKGVWKSGALHDKRQQYDWELVHLRSRISVDAPLISVFGHDDQNGMSFACSDTINLVESNALLREEDNYLYSHLSFFTEASPEITDYETQIRVDVRDVYFADSIRDIAAWWESFPEMKPCHTPELARVPLYSTWYQFHQDLDEHKLLAECKIAKSIGCELIILDDGWQTMDNNRGYDYTGDWRPDRFTNMKGFTDQIHELGMKIGVWFSVPFCGKYSEAYQKFKGKFLTENHRWAPVFDPRYPEVREHLIQIYVGALQEWGIDAFKLDFIDDFQVYPETVLTKENGRDYANVNEAVDRLLTDVKSGLTKVKPDVAIEFRQRYIGPSMRKFGNMFRAFDCPNDPVSNRIRTTDVKLMCGASAVHADMFTWNAGESPELASLQYLNAIFAVPQISVMLTETSEEHLKMLKFYTTFWTDHASILLDGEFTPFNPLHNYPLLKGSLNDHAIYAVYDDLVVTLSEESRMSIINAKPSNDIVIRTAWTDGSYQLTVHDCQGQLITDQEGKSAAGLHEIKVPVGGLITIIKS